MQTIFDQFEKTVRKFPKKNALGFFQEDKLVYWTYEEFHQKVIAVSESLRKRKVKKKDRVAILSQNSPEWAVLYLAAARLGLIVIPIHMTLAGAQIKRIIDQSHAKFLVLGETGLTESFDVLHEILPGLQDEILKLTETSFPSLQGIILLKDSERRLKARKLTSYFSELLAHGNLLREVRGASGRKGSRPARVSPQDISTIMYTSGTTGEMKGVMLTHRNLVENALAAGKLNGVTPQDVTLSILPLSHAFEQNPGFIHQLFHGTTVVYGRGPASLLDDMKCARPTWMAVVPRVLEKMAAAIQDRIERKSPLLGGLFRAGLTRSGLYRQFLEVGNPLAWVFYFQDRVADRFFYQRIREQLGGRLNRFASGGAALDPKTYKFFTDIGIKVLEGYGLTEASPVISVNPVKKPKMGSVGLPLPNLKVRIGKDDEILVKGPSVMAGYENNPRETRRVLDAKGWLHTGDQGSFDKEGYLYIKGRLKELIVTSYGKNILPSAVEKELEKSLYLKQIMICGEGRPFVIALVVPDRPRLEGLFKGPEFFHLSWSELCRHPSVQDFIRKEIEKYSNALANPERPKKIIIVPEEFTEHNSCLTPTLKLRRKVIEERFHERIERLYASA